jgi:hypothetical protein
MTPRSFARSCPRDDLEGLVETSDSASRLSLIIAFFFIRTVRWTVESTWICNSSAHLTDLTLVGLENGSLLLRLNSEDRPVRRERLDDGGLLDSAGLNGVVCV